MALLAVLLWTGQIHGEDSPQGSNVSNTAPQKVSNVYAPQLANESLPARPPYKLLRYDEDYRFLADPVLRTDYLDRIKYIPIDRSGNHYLSLGGEIRERYEFFHNEDAGGQPSDKHGNNNYLLQRILLHADLHLGPLFRVFGQFVSGLEEGRSGGPRPQIDENIFDLHQGFLDVVLPFTDKDSLTVRLGRQELRYGSGRLVDVRAAPNLPRSFDAARLLFLTGEWSVDAFLSKPLRNQPEAFDDDPDPQRSLWGVYAVRPLSFLPGGHADLYYLGFENKKAVFDQGVSRESRHSLGTRLWGRSLPWEYDAEAIWQSGHFGSGDIRAWVFASATHYNLSDLPLRPRLGLRFDVASGDRDPNSAHLQTFNPMFPTGAFYNLQDPAGPQNFIHAHPLLDVYFKNVTVTADWGFFWRTSLDDGVYRLSGVPLRTGQQSRERYVGSSPALTITWAATRQITFLASYSHFFAGPFFKETPPGEDIDYFTTWVSYKF
ncbi:MAG: alginate export family protein [Chromatiales bacterium]